MKKGLPRATRPEGPVPSAVEGSRGTCPERSRGKSRGFTLIEGIILVYVFSLVALAIMTAYVGVYKSIDLAKAKITAVHLANEKMEIIRNMPYDDLATQFGPIYHPPGNMLDDETVTRQGKTFNVHTVIAYVDDPFDNLSPTDIYPYDYKKAEITVSLSTLTASLAQLSTDIAAKAAETPSNTGIIKICVIDAASQPVADATVTITNTTLTPAVNIITTTGSDGCVMVPKLPPDEHNNYHLTATKDGYSTDLTYPRTDQNPNALQPDVNVSVQQVTNQTFVIDLLSSLTLNFGEQGGGAVANVTFTLEGSKKTYFNPTTYKYSQILTTDGSGNITINNLEFDNYRIIDTSSPYFVITTSPLRSVNIDDIWYFPLEPAANLTVQAVLSTSASNPSINNYSPLSGAVGSTVTITVDGGNINNNATIKLQKTIITGSGSQTVIEEIEIVGSNVTVQPQYQIIADFNLSGAVLGNWDLIITNPNAEKVIQTNGFEVTN